MKEKEFESGVGGLICRQCEEAFINDLSYLRGVINVDCSYFRGRAKIKYDEDIVSEEMIKKEMEKAGYPAQEKSGMGKIYDLISLLCVILLFLFIRFVPFSFVQKADNGTSYPMLFLIGLATGTHCMFMCGGIMLSQTSSRRIEAKKKRMPKVLFYNAGRLVMATFLGFLFGSIGKYIMFSLKAKSMIFTLTGCYIVLSSFAMWGLPFLRKIQLGLPSFCDLRKKFPFAERAGPFLAGIFTAILPCASSNSIWLIAVSSGSGIKGMLTMLFWGLGTIPCMIIFGLFSSFLNRKKQALMIRINIVLMMATGMNLAYMGISILL